MAETALVSLACLTLGGRGEEEEEEDTSEKRLAGQMLQEG